MTMAEQMHNKTDFDQLNLSCRYTKKKIGKNKQYPTNKFTEQERGGG